MIEDLGDITLSQYTIDPAALYPLVEIPQGPPTTINNLTPNNYAFYPPPGSAPMNIPDVQRFNQEAASVDYLASDSKFIEQKRMYLQEAEVEVLTKLIAKLKTEAPFLINANWIRGVLKNYFPADYLKKLTETHRKMTVKGVFFAAVLRFIILSRRDEWLTTTKESFLEKYPEFDNVESKWELLALIRFDRAVKLAMDYLSGRGNKQLTLSIGAHLEGSNMQYVTGGQPSPGTKRRVLIFERISGVKPVKRAKRGSSSALTTPSSAVAASSAVASEGGGHHHHYEGLLSSSSSGGGGEGKKNKSNKRGRPPTRHLKYLPGYPAHAGIAVDQEEGNDDNGREEEEYYEEEGEEEDEEPDSEEDSEDRNLKKLLSPSVKTAKNNNNNNNKANIKLTPELIAAAAAERGINGTTIAAATGGGGGSSKRRKKGAGLPFSGGALDMLSRIASEKFQQLDE